MKAKRASFWADQSIKGYWTPIAVRTTRDKKVVGAEIMWNAKYQGEAPKTLTILSVVLTLKTTKVDAAGAPWVYYAR
jgi:hypothetical protein